MFTCPSLQPEKRSVITGIWLCHQELMIFIPTIFLLVAFRCMFLLYKDHIKLLLDKKGAVDKKSSKPSCRGEILFVDCVIGLCVNKGEIVT